MTFFPIISTPIPVLAIDIAYTIYLMTENFCSASATIYMGEYHYPSIEYASRIRIE